MTKNNFYPIILIIFLYGILAYFLSFPNEQGTDLFPVRIGIESLFNGANPYSEYTSNFLKTNWQTALSHAKVATVVAYPAPFLVALSPILLIPANITSTIWFCFLLVMLGVALYKTSSSYANIFAVVLFYPLFHALILQTSSFLWLAIILLCILNTEERKPWFLGILLTLLPLKPQIGLLFFPLAVFIAFRNNRRALPWMLLFSSIIWTVSFLLLPDWIPQWIEMIKLYRLQAVDFSISYLFVVLAFLVGLSTTSLPAFLAIVSLAIFPINDIYSTIVLTIFFRSLPNYSGVILAGFSLGMPLMQYPNSSYALFLFIWLPIFILTLALQLEKLFSRNKILSTEKKD